TGDPWTAVGLERSVIGVSVGLMSSAAACSRHITPAGSARDARHNRLASIGWGIDLSASALQPQELRYEVPADEAAALLATDAGTLKATTGWVSPSKSRKRRALPLASASTRAASISAAISVVSRSLRASPNK